LGDAQVIVLDTHVWIWWVDNNPRLNRSVRDRIDTESDVRISAISLLEIATAVALKRLILRPSAREWLAVAVAVSQVRLEPLTAGLCLDSANLPGEFHRDPADRLIVALARSLDVELLTADGKLLSYVNVKTVDAG
jgi:PIN domain nuclease of toxin-antitoxin system